MNELKFNSLESYMEASMNLVQRGANFRGWEDAGWFYIEIRGY